MATNPIGPKAAQAYDSTQSRPDSQATGKAEQGKGAGQAKNSSPAEDTAGSRPAAGGEKLSISSQARELLQLEDLMRNARNKLDETPEVRADRVREVQERLRAGVYETEGIQDELAHRLSAVLKGLGDE